MALGKKVCTVAPTPSSQGKTARLSPSVSYRGNKRMKMAPPRLAHSLGGQVQTRDVSATTSLWRGSFNIGEPRGCRWGDLLKCLSSQFDSYLVTARQLAAA